MRMPKLWTQLCNRKKCALRQSMQRQIRWSRMADPPPSPPPNAARWLYVGSGLSVAGICLASDLGCGGRRRQANPPSLIPIRANALSPALLASPAGIPYLVLGMFPLQSELPGCFVVVWPTQWAQRPTAVHRDSRLSSRYRMRFAVDTDPRPHHRRQAWALHLHCTPPRQV